MLTSIRPERGLIAACMSASLVLGVADPCQYDYDQSGDVGMADLVHVLSEWGETSAPDLLGVLSSWGDCSETDMKTTTPSAIRTSGTMPSGVTGVSAHNEVTFCFRYRRNAGAVPSSPSEDAFVQYLNHIVVRTKNGGTPDDPASDLVYVRISNNTGSSTANLTLAEWSMSDTWESVVVLLKSDGTWEIYRDSAASPAHAGAGFGGLRFNAREDRVVLGGDAAGHPSFSIVDVGIWRGVWSSSDISDYLTDMKTVNQIKVTSQSLLVGGWIWDDVNYDEQDWEPSGTYGPFKFGDHDLQDASANGNHLDELASGSLPEWNDDYPPGWPYVTTPTWRLDPIRSSPEVPQSANDPSGREPAGAITIRSHNIDHAIGGDAAGQSPRVPTDTQYNNHKAALKLAFETNRASIVCIQEAYDVSMLREVNESLDPANRYKYVICAAGTISRSGTSNDNYLYQFNNDSPSTPTEETGSPPFVHNLSRYDDIPVGRLTGSGHPDLLRHPFRYETGIMSDYPIVEALEFEFRTRRKAGAAPPYLVYYYHKAHILARLDVGNARNLYVGVIHPSHIPSDEPQASTRFDTTQIMIEQMKIMVAGAGEDWATAMCIILGDFNGRAGGMLEEGGGLTTPNKFEQQEILENENFWNTWNNVNAYDDPAIFDDNRYNRFNTSGGATLDYIWTRNLPNNDNIKSVRIPNTGVPNIDLSDAGDPNHPSDHWALQIDTGLGTGISPPSDLTAGLVEYEKSRRTVELNWTNP